jgi:hypothetical protein
MEDVIRRLSNRLAAPSSRRGALRGLGKLAVGVGALVVGQSLFGQVAEAAAAMRCCTGKACAVYACPSGTSLQYTWHCGNYFCHDCFGPRPKGKRHGHYNCTYSVHRPVKHPVQHPVVHHEAPHPKQYATPHGGGGGEALM